MREDTRAVVRARSGAARDSCVSLVLLGGVLLLAALLEVGPGRASLAGMRGPSCPVGSFLGEAACPGCGLTRSTSLAVQGDLAASMRLHPAGILIVALCAAGIAVHVHIVVSRRRSRAHRTLLRLGRLCLLVGLCAVWAARWL